MTFNPTDASAIKGLAGRLKVDPASLVALFERESNSNPNVWGGAGGKYRGLIQFGPEARKEVGLPDKKMTIAEQIPYVETYFQQRGFTPGKHGTTELYRTVLVGNPYQGGTDSWGTNSDKDAKRMMPGGDLYKIGMQKLSSNNAESPISTSSTTKTSPQTTTTATNPLAGVPPVKVSINFGNVGQTKPKANIDPITGLIGSMLGVKTNTDSNENPNFVESLIAKLLQQATQEKQEFAMTPNLYDTDTLSIG